MVQPQVALPTLVLVLKGWGGDACGGSDHASVESGGADDGRAEADFDHAGAPSVSREPGGRESLDVPWVPASHLRRRG